MPHSIHGLQVDKREDIERIEEALGIAGISTHRDDSLGVLSFALNEVDIVEFQVNPDVLKDEAEDRWAQLDAEVVADYYWRQ